MIAVRARRRPSGASKTERLEEPIAPRGFAAKERVRFCRSSPIAACVRCPLYHLLNGLRFRPTRPRSGEAGAGRRSDARQSGKRAPPGFEQLQPYQNGRQHRYVGGHVTRSPYRGVASTDVVSDEWVDLVSAPAGCGSARRSSPVTGTEIAVVLGHPRWHPKSRLNPKSVHRGRGCVHASVARAPAGPLRPPGVGL